MKILKHNKITIIYIVPLVQAAQFKLNSWDVYEVKGTVCSHECAQINPREKHQFAPAYHENFCRYMSDNGFNEELLQTNVLHVARLQHARV